MQGDPEVLTLLNDVLTAELTAINQYFLHAKLCEHWGYDRLASKVRDESIDEMRHSESVMDRIIYLEGHPNLQRLNPLRIGQTVREQLESDLAVEYEAIERLNRGIAACVAVGDNGTRELLDSILTGEEDHTDWLETQLETIRQIGLELYLSQQVNG